MSKKLECTKKKIQPCITTLLPPSTELNAPSMIEAPFESVKTKKREEVPKIW